LTNTFADNREYQSNLFVTQIDIGKYATWLQTNITIITKLTTNGINQYPTVLYVADQRNINTNRLAVVRLSNAAQLPYNAGAGFTVATQNPLYVWGNYNVQTNSGGGTSYGTNNTYYTVPAALISDALTILSTNWVDGNSPYNYTNRTAGITTVNAAIVTGNVPSTGTNSGQFSGGLQNLPRLLENWNPVSGQRNLYLNTSLVMLFSSQMATNQFRDPGNFDESDQPYYDPPIRAFAYDLNFKSPTKTPPAIPVLFLSY